MAARIYVDSSVLVPLFTPEPFSARAQAFVRAQVPILFVTDLAVAEFSSAVARLYRMSLLTKADAQRVFTSFDNWTAQEATRALLEPGDLVAANALVRRLDLGLRPPDAIHLAIAQRLDLILATFDEKMAAAAASLRMELAEI